jgi:hypothetical protein
MRKTSSGGRLLGSRILINKQKSKMRLRPKNGVSASCSRPHMEGPFAAQAVFDGGVPFVCWMLNRFNRPRRKVRWTKSRIHFAEAGYNG